MQNKKGKFFVIDGTDGSGKATQTKLLIERMRREGLPVQTISFPQYGQKSAGPVEEYLASTYGSPEEVGARRASIFYAVDRYAASKKIRGWLDSGSHVIADRYVASNMGHQGGKISDPSERQKFFRWNDELEYGLFGIPRPNLNIILHVPPEISQKLMASRPKFDAHECDLEHLKNAEQTYLEIARTSHDFVLIECLEEGALLSPEAVHELVWDEIKKNI